MNVLDRVSVSVRSINSKDNDGDTYKAFTDVEADILLDGNKIGGIEAVLVDRQKIPDHCFYEAFDELSADMEWVGTSLLENRYGRTKLQSLREYDDPEFDFMFIRSFHVNDDCRKDGNTDIASAALRKFLFDPSYIKGQLNYGCWQVSSAAYVTKLVNEATMNEPTDRKRKRGDDDEDELARMDAMPFLRNGFFQDPALVREDSDNARLLVASYGNWNKPLRSQAEVSKVNLLSNPSSTPSSNPSSTPSGKDLEILKAVKLLVAVDQHHTVNWAAIMVGQEQYVPPGDPVTAQQLATLRSDLARLVQARGSISRSNALHLACEHNSPSVVSLLLEMDPAAINSQDAANNRTPLMVAAMNASGRCSISGIDDTQVIDRLLAAGANKSLTDSVGMTAYGYFRKTSKMMVDITHLACRGKLVGLESKLCPPEGPSVVDMSDGKGSITGFVDYGSEDDEADREMGLGRYADSEDEADY